MRAVTTTKTRATKRARVTKRARATRAMAEPSPREKGDDGPPPGARVHNNQLLRQLQRQGTWWRRQWGWQRRRQGQRRQGLRGRRRWWWWWWRQTAMKTTRTATAKTTTKGWQSGQQQQRRVSVVNLAEAIVAEDIVIPATPPLRPQLPRCGTLLSDHVVYGYVYTLYFTWEYIENLDKTWKKSGKGARSGTVGRRPAVTDSGRKVKKSAL